MIRSRSGRDPAAIRFALDAVSPVVLFGWAGHGTLFNTRAMPLLALGEAQVIRSAARSIGCPARRSSAASRTSTRSSGSAAASDLLPDAALVGAYRGFAAQAAQLGFTTLQDMAVGLTHDRAMSVLRAAEVPLRVRSMCRSSSRRPA